MLSRRLFAGCALCGALGLLADPVRAQAPAPALVRTVLSTVDYPGEGKHSILMLLEAAPETLIARHTHPGIESSIIMDGEIELEIMGQGLRRYSPGQGFQVPPGVPHGGKVLARPAKLAITYVVEKDKPLASPA